MEDALAQVVGDAFGPFFDVAMLRVGRIDLLYSTACFQQKNGRWPASYSELSDFVQESNGYLFLAKYERVDFNELPNHILEVTCVPEGRTNEMRFSIGDVVSKR